MACNRSNCAELSGRVCAASGKRRGKKSRGKKSGKAVSAKADSVMDPVAKMTTLENLEERFSIKAKEIADNLAFGLSLDIINADRNVSIIAEDLNRDFSKKINDKKYQDENGFLDVPRVFARELYSDSVNYTKASIEQLAGLSADTIFDNDNGISKDSSVGELEEAFEENFSRLVMDATDSLQERANIIKSTGQYDLPERYIEILERDDVREILDKNDLHWETSQDRFGDAVVRLGKRSLFND